MLEAVPMLLRVLPLLLVAGCEKDLLSDVPDAGPDTGPKTQSQCTLGIDAPVLANQCNATGTQNDPDALKEKFGCR